MLKCGADYENSPLNDGAGLARDIEVGYQAMWRKHCGEKYLKNLINDKANKQDKIMTQISAKKELSTEVIEAHEKSLLLARQPAENT